VRSHSDNYRTRFVVSVFVVCSETSRTNSR
jgi:hypothetical protein